MTERRPRWVYDTGEEPDPRFTLANERTFLAWVRTSIGLLAVACALYALDLPAHAGARTALVLSVLVLGAACAVLSAVRWARVERALRRREPLPAFLAAPAMAGAIVLMALLLAAAVVL